MKKFGDPALYKSFVSGIVTKRTLNQNKNINIIAYKNAGNVLTPEILGPPKSGALGLTLFSLMVNLRLYYRNVWIVCAKQTSAFDLLSITL